MAPDQPSSNPALTKLDALVGEWEMEAIPPGGEPWPGDARSTCEWHESGALLVWRTAIDMPEAPNSVSVIGADAANGTYFQLYTDDRDVSRVYEMTLNESEWTLSRNGDPFPQRFRGTFEDGGSTIRGRWEKALDGGDFEVDFDLIYRRVEAS